MRILCLIASIWILAIVFRPIPRIRQTSVRTAVLWAQAFSLVMLAGAVAELFVGLSDGWRTLFLWSTAVLGLTPFVDVLGARRPQHQAWPLFVVAPMILVFHWPAVAHLVAGGTQSAIEIPAPFGLGFVLVVLMGCGNYFGTANTMSAILAGTGLLLLTLPLTVGTSLGSTWQYMGPILLALAAALTSAPQRPTDADETATGAAQLWVDFCELFGMVWAKRVMDRVNQFADREAWAVRLSLFGFVPRTLPPESTGDEANERSTDTSRRSLANTAVPDERATMVLCWVLRRFLDREFMERYVPAEQIRDSLAPQSRD